MDEVERLLRLLALNDEESVAMVLATEPNGPLPCLSPKVDLLVRLGALLAPAVGVARVVSSAPRLALALGYEIDADE
jgi:hypothetical protein